MATFDSPDIEQGFGTFYDVLSSYLNQYYFGYDEGYEAALNDIMDEDEADNSGE